LRDALRYGFRAWSEVNEFLDKGHCGMLRNIVGCSFREKCVRRASGDVLFGVLVFGVLVFGSSIYGKGGFRIELF